MSARATALAVLACACRVDLGPAPFTCTTGACPSGYHCATGLCVADGEPNPPQEVAVADGRSEPQPVWVADQRFLIAWTQQAVANQTGPGLFSATLSPDGIGAPNQLAANTGDIAFMLLHHAGAQQLVAAVRVNLPDSARLEVVRQGLSDVGGPDGITTLLDLEQTGVPEGYGFSAPSLAESDSRSAMLAFAFSAPPDSVADNAYCLTLDLPTATADAGCRPSSAITGGTFAAEAWVTADEHGWLMSWRDVTVHLTGELDGTALGRIDTSVSRLLYPAMIGTHVAAVVSTNSPDGGAPAWSLGVASTAGAQIVPRATQLSPSVVPDLVAAAGAFVACGVDADGKLFVSWLSPDDLTPLRPPAKVYRVSMAAVLSCRVAVAEDGTVAVAWQEPLPNGGDSYRVFAALVPGG